MNRRTTVTATALAAICLTGCGSATGGQSAAVASIRSAGPAETSAPPSPTSVTTRSTTASAPPRAAPTRHPRTLVTVTVTQPPGTSSAESVTVSMPPIFTRTAASSAGRTPTARSATPYSTSETATTPHPATSPAGLAGHPLPRLTPAVSDFASPQAVAAQYLSVWCYLPVAGQANENIARVAGWVTAAGWADDKARAIGGATWAEIQDQGISTVCGPVTATLNHEGPETERRKFVQLTTTRYRIAAGWVIDSDTIATQRRVLRADDGRWLVDIQVDAG